MQFVAGAQKADDTVEMAAPTLLSPGICAWFAKLGLSETSVTKVAGFVCSDEVGVSEISELLLLDEDDLRATRKLLPKVKVSRFNEALEALRTGQQDKAAASPGATPGRGQSEGLGDVASEPLQPSDTAADARRRRLRRSISGTSPTATPKHGGVLVTVADVINAANTASALVPLLFVALQMEENTDVVQLILTAINSLALKSAEDRIFLGDCEACYAVAYTMQTFEDHPKIVELACAAVAGLTMDNEMNQTRLGDTEQVDAPMLVCAAMKKNLANRDLLLNACTAISAIAMDHQANIAAFRDRCGAIEAIEAFMSRWPDDEGVSHACEIAMEELSAK